MDLSVRKGIPDWAIAAALAVVIAAGGMGAYVAWSGSSGENRRGNLVCEKCGHQFEISAQDYHAAQAESRGANVRCPKCGQLAAEPVMARCPKCQRPIRHRDVEPGSPAHLQRLCPFCGQKMPA